MTRRSRHTRGAPGRAGRRAVLLASAVLVAVTLSFTAVPPAGAAGTGDDYPTAAAGCYLLATLAGPQTCNLRSDPQDRWIDPWGFANRECVSFVAWRLNQQSGHTAAPWAFKGSMNGPNGTKVDFGDAGHWDEAAKAGGWPVDQTPAVGAVAQWNPNEAAGTFTAGPVGHVGIVVAVAGDGSVTVEDYNAGSPSGGYASRTGMRPPRFIHIADASVPAAPTTPSAVGGAAAAAVSWTRPADRGSAITGFRVTPFKAGVAQPAVTVTNTTSTTVTGLAAGVSYTFTVTAVNGAGTGPASPASNAVVPTASGPSPAPFASWDAFVTRQLTDLAGSPGTISSRAAVVAQLKAGTLAPATYVSNLISGPWFGPHVAPVARLYWAYFGRTPDYAGLTYWAGQVRAGVSLGVASQSFARSREFAATYGTLTDAAFVQLVYRNVLGRPPDAKGVAYWVGKLATGTTRGKVMIGFSESPEYRNRTAAQVDVLMVYAGMLHRSPSADELAAGKALTRAALIATILASPRYAALVT